MNPQMTYQLHRLERGFTASEQRAADIRRGELAASAASLAQRVAHGLGAWRRLGTRTSRTAPAGKTVPARARLAPPALSDN